MERSSSKAPPRSMHPSSVAGLQRYAQLARLKGANVKGASLQLADGQVMVKAPKNIFQRFWAWLTGKATDAKQDQAMQSFKTALQSCHGGGKTILSKYDNEFQQGQPLTARKVRLAVKSLNENRIAHFLDQQAKAWKKTVTLAMLQEASQEGVAKIIDDAMSRVKTRIMQSHLADKGKIVQQSDLAAFFADTTELVDAAIEHCKANPQKSPVEALAVVSLAVDGDKELNKFLDRPVDKAAQMGHEVLAKVLKNLKLLQPLCAESLEESHSDDYRARLSDTLTRLQKRYDEITGGTDVKVSFDSDQTFNRELGKAYATDIQANVDDIDDSNIYGSMDRDIGRADYTAFDVDIESKQAMELQNNGRGEEVREKLRNAFTAQLGEDKGKQALRDLSTITHQGMFASMMGLVMQGKAPMASTLGNAPEELTKPLGLEGTKLDYKIEMSGDKILVTAHMEGPSVTSLGKYGAFPADIQNSRVGTTLKFLYTPRSSPEEPLEIQAIGGHYDHHFEPLKKHSIQPQRSSTQPTV